MRLKRGFLVLLLIIVVCVTSCDIGKESAENKQNWRPAQEVATMERLFEVALAPVGNTMYVWGGGWDPDDAKAGKTATQIGLASSWADFAAEQTAEYDFEEYLENSEQEEYWGRNLQELGLDCSGYVGWVIYNLFETKDKQEGYVSQSTGMAKCLANRGWGKLIRNPNEFLPGDIVSMQGHVWISLGTCEDGSVLLVHSSPPGVSVCGTVVPESMVENGVEDAEDENSIAVILATEFMSANFPKWQEKYPNRKVVAAYLENVTVFRWNSDTLKDAEEYQALSGEEIMKILQK